MCWMATSFQGMSDAPTTRLNDSDSAHTAKTAPVMKRRLGGGILQRGRLSKTVLDNPATDTLHVKGQRLHATPDLAPRDSCWNPQHSPFRSAQHSPRQMAPSQPCCCADRRKRDRPLRRSAAHLSLKPDSTKCLRVLPRAHPPNPARRTHRTLRRWSFSWRAWTRACFVTPSPRASVPRHGVHRPLGMCVATLSHGLKTVAKVRGQVEKTNSHQCSVRDMGKSKQIPSQLITPFTKSVTVISLNVNKSSTLLLMPHKKLCFQTPNA